MDMRGAFDATVALAEQRGMPETRGAPGLTLGHLRDMRSRIQPDFSEAKLGRWLGWAQCAVVAAGYSSLSEMKRINLDHA